MVSAKIMITYQKYSSFDNKLPYNWNLCITHSFYGGRIGRFICAISYFLICSIFNIRWPLNLARWYNEVERFDYMEFNKVLDTFSSHSTTIINYFEERLTNASAESFNAKIKAFRNQLRGVADVKFFLFRLAMLYA